MEVLCKVLIFSVLAVVGRGEDLQDFDFANDGEIMVAQESRQYQTIVKPPVRIVKPNGVTNSHRPQYNLDSIEDLQLEELFKPTVRTFSKGYKTVNQKLKEGLIRDAVLRALERKDHVGKFAQVLPIIRAMSGNQRVALASLVANQVSTPPGRAPLNLAQVRSMFGNSANTTTDLMLPILLDMANLVRRAIRSGKESREVKQPNTQTAPAQLLRRSFTEEDITFDDEPFNTGYDKTTTAKTFTQKNRILRARPTRTLLKQNVTADNATQDKVNTDNKNINYTDHNRTSDNTIIDDKNTPKSSTPASVLVSSPLRSKSSSNASQMLDNSTLDLAVEASNQTIAQDLPVAEKLRSINRYIDRKGNLIRRGTYPIKPTGVRRTTAEPTLSPISRRRPPPARKLPSAIEQAKCELFTNTLCLHAEDYPTDAIVQSIRRNKAAAGALLADFKDPGEGAVDGITAAQEAKYTAEHYLVSNRRGDTANRDFASAGEAGFMCPSTVKYARPQRARATSGQWKYIVNTGEHTQTLRLEKCLKPKESCTYLTDNFKSKCVQVYNYHRLLTWDQQNGLHMDIFKVPTCCSCHIEGYSVEFPPLGHRVHDTSSENQFPAEDLSSEHGNHAFEAVQSTIQRPTVTKSPPFTHNKPLESFPPFSDSQNLLIGTSFNNGKVNDNEDFNSPNIQSSNPMDSYGNTYFPDSFNQASSVRNVKRPLMSRNPSSGSGFDSATLPSYLEPPTPSAPSTFSFSKESPAKHNIPSKFKRGPIRPSRRPIRKKISGAPDDLVSSGTTSIGTLTNSNVESLEDFNDDIEEPDAIPPNPPKRVTIAPKLNSALHENNSTAHKTQAAVNIVRETITSNGKRVNYNYHPIIDYFGEEERVEDDSSIDREDSEAEFIPPSESEWKPMNNPPSRNTATNSVGRKKHK